MTASMTPIVFSTLERNKRIERVGYNLLSNAQQPPLLDHTKSHKGTVVFKVASVLIWHFMIMTCQSKVVSLR